MNEKTKNILGFDPLETAETLLGKKINEFDVETDGMLALDLVIVSNKLKKEHLKNIGDTYFGMSWQNFIKIAKSYGFKDSFSQKFIGEVWPDEKGVEEEEIILFHEEKGLILHAKSFEGKSLGSAIVYGEVKINKKHLTKKQCDALKGCSHDSSDNETMHFDIDVREGMLFHLDAISEAFEFCTTWTRVPFLCFINNNDIKKEDYDYEKITKEKINACTAEVRKIIFG